MTKNDVHFRIVRSFARGPRETSLLGRRWGPFGRVSKPAIGRYSPATRRPTCAQ